jgi:uncharacterized membrane protein HdeD (DUF308 family)
MKGIKIGGLVSALVYLVFGVILVMYPQLSTTIICYMFGGILVICAIFHLISFLKNKNKARFAVFNLMIAVITGVIGAWILLKPSIVIMMIPIIFGIVLILHGIISIKEAIELKSIYDHAWWSILLLVLVDFILAAAFFVNPFPSMSVLVRVIGIGLLFDGLLDIWVMLRRGLATRAIKKTVHTLNKE